MRILWKWRPEIVMGPIENTILISRPFTCLQEHISSYGILFSACAILSCLKFSSSWKLSPISTYVFWFDNQHATVLPLHLLRHKCKSAISLFIEQWFLLRCEYWQTLAHLHICIVGAPLVQLTFNSLILLYVLHPILSSECRPGLSDCFNKLHIGWLDVLILLLALVIVHCAAQRM